MAMDISDTEVFYDKTDNPIVLGRGELHGCRLEPKDKKYLLPPPVFTKPFQIILKILNSPVRFIPRR